MENIRKYVEYVYSSDFDKEGCYIKMFECVDAVTNKLVTMNDSNQKAYSRIILNYIWNYMCVEGEFSDAINNIDNYDIAGNDDETSELIYFLYELSDVFKCFGISLNQESINLGYKKIVLTEPNESQVYDRRYFRKKKEPTATTPEQVDVIRTLLKSAGIEYSSDVDLAKFISWLCGGTEFSIRNNGLVPNTGYENEEVLKEKFALIGIEYEKGRIKQRTNNL